MEAWEIRQDSRGAWYWRAVTEEGSHRVSAGVFETRHAALEDAIAHGYIPAPERNGENGLAAPT